MVRRILLALTAALLAVALLPAVAVADGHLTVEVVATGLDNPRGVAVHGSSVYVAEAGRGGDGPCVEGPEGLTCFGLSGAVTEIRKGHQHRVVEGLPSLAGADGSAAIGPADVARKGGDLLVPIGLGLHPEARATFGEDGELLGTLVAVKRKGKHAGEVSMIADLAAFEAASNPDGPEPDSNPTSVFAKGKDIWVVDAGGNDLLRTGKQGGLSVTAVFPATPPGAEIPMDAVPTAVVRGKDKALYVGQLTGFPFPVAGAAVFRIGSSGTPEVYAAGFTNIMDLAFDKDGTLYVLEIAHNGLLSGDPTGGLWAVHPDGTKELLLTAPLFLPGGLDTGKKGEIYVSSCGICPGGGELLRITR